jgi:hypothetical protein
LATRTFKLVRMIGFLIPRLLTAGFTGYWFLRFFPTGDSRSKSCELPAIDRSATKSLRGE